MLKELVLFMLSPGVQANLAYAGFAQLPAAQLSNERNEIAAINPYVSASGPASAPAGATSQAAAASAGGGLPWWAILVIVLGVLALLAALGGAAFVLRHRRKRRRSLPLSVRCAARLCCRKSQGSEVGCLEGCWCAWRKVGACSCRRAARLCCCPSPWRPGCCAAWVTRRCRSSMIHP